MQYNRHRIAYRVIACLILALILLLLLMPGVAVDWSKAVVKQLWPWALPDSPSSADFPTDKLIHAGLYALAGLVLVRGWLTPSGSWVPLCLLLFTHGALTEALQFFIPGRGAELGDLLADYVGALVGVGAAVWVLKSRWGKGGAEE